MAPDRALRADLDDAIEHVVARIGLLFEKGQYRVQQSQRAGTIDGGKDDKAWMHIDLSDERPKVAGVLSDKDPVLFDAPPQHRVVQFAAPSDIERVKGIKAELVKAPGEAGRQAFVDKESQGLSSPWLPARTADERIGARIGDRGLDGLPW
jgi:hypothetical protein